jgi:hypothetical protein
VERSIELTVAAPVEPHPLDLARARWDRRHPGQGCRRVGRSEAPDIADLGDESRDGDWPGARQPEKRMADDAGGDPAGQGIDRSTKTGEAGKERPSELRLDGCPSSVTRARLGDRPPACVVGSIRSSWQTSTDSLLEGDRLYSWR